MHADKRDKTPIRPEEQRNKDELWKQFKAQFRAEVREAQKRGELPETKDDK